MAIDVWKDTEGVRMALEEIFERDFARANIDRAGAQANEATRARLERTLPAELLAYGYYRFAEHLLHLDAMQRAGIRIGANQLTAFEAAGLVALHRARKTFEGNHPACSACGQRQHNRFGRECPGCGAKFRHKRA